MPLPDDAEERGADLLDCARSWNAHEAFLLEELVAEHELDVTLSERGRLVIKPRARSRRRAA